MTARASHTCSPPSAAPASGPARAAVGRARRPLARLLPRPRRPLSLVVAGLAAVLAAVTLRGEHVDACAWSGPTVEDLSTFDPQILGEDSDGLSYDPFDAGFGAGCQSCLTDAMLADWSGFLGPEVAAADWEAVLFRATPSELGQLGDVLAGKRKQPPAVYAKSSLWRATTATERLRAALPLVKLARDVEAVASATADGERPATTPPKVAEALLGRARSGARTAREDFLRQRYAFLQLKIRFYQRDWDGVVRAAEELAKPLAAPSNDLAWRARYYVAGALMRAGARARANLELARIHAGYPALAGPAANDFRPVEETDWRESLRLAKGAKEKAELWRLVGLTRDGLVALREIAKLDARSPLIPLLLVREVERAESRTADAYGMGNDPGAEERQRRDFSTLEQLALQLAQSGDRPWLSTLVAGHLAAKRGDLASAKDRLAKALRARPTDARVKAQVKASLALALVLDGALRGKSPPATLAARAEEVAAAMSELEPTFGRYGRVRGDVRSTLASAFAASGKLVEAELLAPGFLESQPAHAAKWHDPVFLQALIERAEKSATAFDRFLGRDSYSREQLLRELGGYHLTAGAFEQAARAYAALGGGASKLGTDPFVIHVIDCHDCDHERYADAPWTHASLAAKLAKLEKTAKGTGDQAMGAALLLGNALYNLTWYGNARVVLADTHQSASPRAAERWYKRAYDVAKTREDRARAAYLAAKAELGSLITAAEKAANAGASELAIDPLPTPATWFPVLETYADTRYYREILAECSNFRAYVERADAKPSRK